MADYVTIESQALTRAIAAIVAAGGSSAEEARQVAESLVGANLTGHDSHGVGMIPRYVDSLLEGGLLVDRRPSVKLDSGALLALDGERGYGQTIGKAAMEMGIERAGRHGACIMTLANSHHLGRIGQWAEQATAAGMISLHFVNVMTRPSVAPFGGSDARFGTNPCCIGVPLEGQPPMILDFATSAVAQGKMRVAHNKGEKVPPGRLIDDKGQPTDDPRYVVIPPWGALLPFGEHKGSGLAVVCELLGGALTGGGTWHGPHDGSRRVYNGMLTILIDPAKVGNGADAFARESLAFVDSLRQSPPAPGFDKVRIAGEPERETRAKRQAEGIPVDGTTWEEILAAGEKVKVSRVETMRAAGLA
ncbi:malate/lactate/ureidoglycolate dehydrogenase [Burkholderiaceae bacterium FT117]|uniref:malate/lactate/ureidoglycolate dehydrogenase n=1 Tax=Zeimonas sediminis TaxID=2944268 RepID=UPI002342EFFB|nr:malate/lactate/ureidoglycolate dehydrogenase [Zeimonas sediminis]MCM5572309.1 malate/lactate/ureidoglycolate dehydrogenase [Zeimonas sediminis]